MASPSTCRLCKREGKLALSHILPAFILRGIEYPKLKGAQYQPHVVHVPALTSADDAREVQSGSWERSAGVKEYLFCSDCEGKISGWESYAREFLYSRDAGQPQKRPLLAAKVIPTGVSSYGRPESVRICRAEYVPFKLFQMSILYRAAVCTGDWGRRVQVSNRATARLRDMLHRSDPGQQDDFPCCMMNLDIGHIPLEAATQTPYTVKEGKVTTSIFVFGGYAWLYETSLSRSNLAKHSLLPSSGEFLLFDAGGEVVAEQLWHRVHGSPA